MNSSKGSAILLAVGILVILLPSMGVLAETPKDGKYYFDQLKESMLEILAENQGLFNTNSDGSVKSSNLIPKAIYKKSYDQFKKIGVGKTFKLKTMEGEMDPEKIAPVLATLLSAGRITIAKSQKEINTEADGSVKLKMFIPAVFGKLAGDRFQEKTGITMKQTTLGKDGRKARNHLNAPDEWETMAMEKFMASGWETNKGYGETVAGEYRYAKPIYIKKGCLGCHGEAAGEKGIYGHEKEGYKVNEIRGGISVALPVQ